VSNSSKPSRSIWILNHYALAPDLPGGTRHFDLAYELTQMGYEVTIFASAFNHKLREKVRLLDGAPWDIESTDGVRFVWVDTFSYQGNSWRRFLNMISFMVRAYFVGRQLPQKEHIASPDVIIGSSVHLLAVFAAYMLSRHFGVSFVMEVRDLWPQTLVDMGRLGEKSILTRSLRKLETLLYKRAARIIVLLPKAKEYIVSLGVKPDKVTWIPNGVNLRRYGTVMPGLSQDEKLTCMYAGNHGINALPTLLEAAEVVQHKGYEDISFVLVGDGHEKPNLIAYADQLGLENMEFRAAVPKEEIPSVLQQADVLVSVLRDLSLYKYGISLNKLFDYLASARPVILTGDPVNNIVEDAQCGLTAPPDDPEALADAIIQLHHKSPEERQAMGARGRAHVEQHYNTKMLAGRLHRILKDMMDESSARH
jgi:glycosyltransferase involved in cell wall biosynthesis